MGSTEATRDRLRRRAVRSQPLCRCPNAFNSSHRGDHNRWYQFKPSAKTNFETLTAIPKIELTKINFSPEAPIDDDR